MTDTVEAAIVFENGRLSFAPADMRKYGLKTGPKIDAIAWCDLKADVSAHGHSPGDIHFDAIYAVSHFKDFAQPLEGQDRKEAEAILLANAEWLKWAREEIRERRRAA